MKQIELDIKENVSVALNERILRYRDVSSGEVLVYHRLNGSTHLLDEITALILETLLKENSELQRSIKKLEMALHERGLQIDDAIESRIEKLKELDLLTIKGLE